MVSPPARSVHQSIDHYDGSCVVWRDVVFEAKKFETRGAGVCPGESALPGGLEREQLTLHVGAMRPLPPHPPEQ